jgi:hypothetical protein
VVAIELEQQEVIVPVLGRDSSEANLRFLGTGSIVGDGSILLTADHVVAGWPGQLFITTVPDHLREVDIDAKDPNPLWPLKVAERDDRHDLALLRITGYRSNNPLSVWFDFPLHENWDVLTFEYSTTREQGGWIRLSPAARRGHITRMLTVDTLGPAGNDALEVSFPAIRGSSGAPVMYDYRGSFNIIGVLKSNYSYHLLPAEVQVALKEDNTMLDEVSYFLPQGIAVNINHLRSMYDRVVGTNPSEPQSF